MCISGGDDKFYLNEETGQLYPTSKQIDRETRDRYNLTVNVTDKGKPLLWVSLDAIAES